MENRMNDLVILLTGTITPNSLSNLTIKDPAIRRQQYYDALKFYIENTKFRIVFAENSNDALENFPLFPDRIEYLSFYSKPIQPDRGIGYKELEIINFAFQNSKFINEAKSIVKITGRLKVLNFNKISGKFLKLVGNESNLIYAHSFGIKNMDARCFFFTIDFWPYLKKVGRDINLRYNFELSLWDAISQYQSIKEKKYMELNIPLRIDGKSGSFGNKYKHNLLLHYARLIRNHSSSIFGNKLMKE